MNKRKLESIVNLYCASVSLEACISAIIDMSRSNTEAGIFVAKFIKRIFIQREETL
jgi:hypothetical protein